MNGVEICNSIFDAMKESLFNGTFRNTYRIHNAFTRDRNLSFENLFLYLLNASKEAMPINIAYMIEKYPTISFPDISKQAISKARQGMAPEVFETIFRMSTRLYYQKISSLSTCNDFHILAIDGTSLQLPQTMQNITTFGAAMNQNDSCCGIASASVCFDVLNDMIVDARIHSYHYGERKLASMHIEQMEHYGFFPNTLFVFDRGYPSYDLYQEIQEKNQFFLMRTNSRTHRSIQQDGKFQFEVKGRGDPPLTLRMVHVILADGTIEKLVTNLFDPAINSDMFKELYFLRWGIESKYREFKNRLEIERFTGCLPICIRQDFYIAMFKSNLSAIIKHQADKDIRQERIEKKNKYDYQANRGFIINRIHNCIVSILIGMHQASELLHMVLALAKRGISQIQPGRNFSRKRKMTRRKYHSNQKPCL